jgi:hypothetical protein
MEALMTGREFFNAVSNGNTDLLQLFLNILEEVSAQYCVIGGLAVNAYAEPVVSLDLDIVLVAGKQENVISASEAAGLKVQEFEHSINLSTTDSRTSWIEQRCTRCWGTACGLPPRKMFWPGKSGLGPTAPAGRARDRRIWPIS